MSDLIYSSMGSQRRSLHFYMCCGLWWSSLNSSLWVITAWKYSPNAKRTLIKPLIIGTSYVLCRKNLHASASLKMSYKRLDTSSHRMCSRSGKYTSLMLYILCWRDPQKLAFLFSIFCMKTSSFFKLHIFSRETTLNMWQNIRDEHCIIASPKETPSSFFVAVLILSFTDLLTLLVSTSKVW